MRERINQPRGVFGNCRERRRGVINFSLAFEGKQVQKHHNRGYARNDVLVAFESRLKQICLVIERPDIIQKIAAGKRGKNKRA